VKLILVEAEGFENGKLFDPDDRDACLEPFIHLRARLRALGYALETADDRRVTDADWVWFFNVPQEYRRGTDGWAPRTWWRRFARRPRALHAECLAVGLRARTVLFLTEPTVVIPENGDARLHAPFPAVFTWDDRDAGRGPYIKFREPSPSPFPEVPRRGFRDRKLLVTITGNKSSREPGELYSARRRTIRHFERARPHDFDLFGTDWDRGAETYPSYRGPVRHKWTVYPNYRFGLCYENAEGVPGLVSEKIFDCLRAGCVPVYWGAPNIAQYVDADAFIDRTSFASDAELEAALADMSEAEFLRNLAAGREYLRSDRFRAFLSPAFAESIIRGLRLA